MDGLMGWVGGWVSPGGRMGMGNCRVEEGKQRPGKDETKVASSRVTWSSQPPLKKERGRLSLITLLKCLSFTSLVSAAKRSELRRIGGRERGLEISISLTSRSTARAARAYLFPFSRKCLIRFLVCFLAYLPALF